jgi:branched-chain amino acid aminotransferase
MSTTIKVQRIDATKIHNIDFSNLTFGASFSDHVFIADYKNGEWKNFRIEPFGPLSLSPSAMALHYGQAIFEGMKATKALDGKPYFGFLPFKGVLFISDRLCLPLIPF